MTLDLGALGRTPVLEGELVRLRPFVEGDAQTMHEVLADPEVQVLTGSVVSSTGTSPFDLDGLRAWYGSREDQDDRLDLGVEDRASGRLVGEVVLNELDPAAASANIRVLLGPQGRGRGLGTEAMRLTLAHAFERVGLHRVSLHVISHNPRARHVYESLGFVHEGTLRESVVLDGERHDEHVMSLLAPEWAALTAAKGVHPPGR